MFFDIMLGVVGVGVILIVLLLLLVVFLGVQTSVRMDEILAALKADPDVKPEEEEK